MNSPDILRLLMKDLHADMARRAEARKQAIAQAPRERQSIYADPRNWHAGAMVELRISRGPSVELGGIDSYQHVGYFREWFHGSDLSVRRLMPATLSTDEPAHIEWVSDLWWQQSPNQAPMNPREEQDMLEIKARWRELMDELCRGFT